MFHGTFPERFSVYYMVFNGTERFLMPGSTFVKTGMFFWFHLSRLEFQTKTEQDERSTTQHDAARQQHDTQHDAARRSTTAARHNK